jgi:hypothetical protein
MVIQPTPISHLMELSLVPTLRACYVVTGALPDAAVNGRDRLSRFSDHPMLNELAAWGGRCAHATWNEARLHIKGVFPDRQMGFAWAQARPRRAADIALAG